MEERKSGMRVTGVKVIGSVIEQKTGFVPPHPIPDSVIVKSSDGQPPEFMGNGTSFPSSLGCMSVKDEPQDPGYGDVATVNHLVASNHIKEESQAESLNSNMVFTSNRPEVVVKLESQSVKENPYPTNLVMVKRENYAEINEEEKQITVKMEISEPGEGSDDEKTSSTLSTAEKVKSEESRKGHKCHICNKVSAVKCI